MTRTRSALLTLLFLIQGTCHAKSVYANPQAPRTFYVCPTGNDENTGTLQHPFRTLTGARDHVRGINREMQSDIHVRLRGGEYPIETTLTFDERDSGFNSHWVIYEAYEDEEPVLNGGTRVNGWTSHNGNIYKASLQRSGKLRTLIINGQRAYMAKKEVNALGGWGDHIVKQGEAEWAWSNCKQRDGVMYSVDEVPLLQNPMDLEISARTTWNMNVVCAREVITEGEHRILKLQQPYGVMAQTPWWGAAFSPKGKQTLHNAMAFLDEEGEFYFNDSTDTLYVYTEKVNMDTAQVYAPRLCTLLNIEGSSRAKRIRNIKIQGLTFAHSEATLPRVGNSSGKTTVQASTYFAAVSHGNWHVDKYRAYDTMPNAIHVASAQNIILENNIIKHIGGEGIGFINDVLDSKIIGNAIYDVGGSAIQIGHPQHLYERDGDDREKYSVEREGVCKDNLIKNNLLYDLTNMYYGHSGLTAFFVDGLVMEHNHIQGTNYSGVNLGWGWGNFDSVAVPDNPTVTARNNHFNYNRIFDCMKILADGGAFYTLGSQPNSSARGNYVKADTTHFMGVWYHDEGSAWFNERDMVFDVVPGQTIVQANDDHRKNDLYLDNIYATSKNMRLGPPTVKVTNIKVHPESDWPPEALAIIEKSGLEPEYRHLLKFLPSKPKARKTLRIEGESARLIKRATITESESASGGKIVMMLDTPGDGIEFNNFPATEKIYIWYAGGNCTHTIYVNGKEILRPKYHWTGGWESISRKAIDIDIPEGATVRFAAQEGDAGINIDCVFLECSE